MSTHQTENSIERSSSLPPFVLGIDLGTTNSVMALAQNRNLFLPAQSSSGHEMLGKSFIEVQLFTLEQSLIDGTVVEQVLFPSVVYQASADTKRYVGVGASEAKYSAVRGRNVFYSVKSDIGSRGENFYPRAVSPELRTPAKISAEILKAMRISAENQLGISLSTLPVTITVPASFQSAQRLDTLRAAQWSGFSVTAHNLLDEPNAALLGYINQQRIEQRWAPEETVLIFDFGGGTCDVAIIEVSRALSNNRVTLSARSISRFEQLGGDDIDRHLAHTYLVPEFYRQSGKAEKEWGAGERRQRIWSQLYKIAEQLKVRYCKELDNVAQSSNWDAVTMQGVKVGLPEQLVYTSAGEIRLSSLSLDYVKFREIMKDYINPTELRVKEGSDDEYRISSIFGPVRDALSKAQMKVRDVTRVLLVGGSSYNPEVEQALRGHFEHATIDRPGRLEYLVAEGAAVHSYYRHYFGVDVLQPILGDTIGILGQNDIFVPLIAAGALIPYPAEGDWTEYGQFRVPKEGLGHVDLILCAGSKSHPIHRMKLRFDRPVPASAAIRVRVRMDANKVFHFAANLPDYPGIHVYESLENPLTTMPLTAEATRRKELEAVLKDAVVEGTQANFTDEMEELAELLVDMNRAERALEWIEQVDRITGHASSSSRYLRARAQLKLGETRQAHREYLQLAKESPRDWTLWYMTSVTADSLGEREQYMRQGLDAAPANPHVLHQLGMLRGYQKDYAGKKEFLEEARSVLLAERKTLKPSRERLRLLATVYDELGDTSSARRTRAEADQIPVSSGYEDDVPPEVVLLA